jgi:hypothetical protein
MQYINSNSNFLSIDRCGMEGMREGDCLRMTRVVSRIAPDRAAKLDAHCRPIYQADGQKDVCKDACDRRYPNGFWNPDNRQCTARCASTYPTKIDAECRSINQCGLKAFSDLSNGCFGNGSREAL